MEACHGDLGRITDTSRILDSTELRHITKGILVPLHYMHNKKELKEAEKIVVIHRYIIFLLPATSKQFFCMSTFPARDLKPANILLMVPGSTPDEDIDWKNVDVTTLDVIVGDLGLARYMPAKEKEGGSAPSQTSQVGTRSFRAPEVKTGKYDQSADIYSFGAIIYKLATGTPLKENFGTKAS